MPSDQLIIEVTASAHCGEIRCQPTQKKIGPITTRLPTVDHWRVWDRIEPRCRSDDFLPGLQARTADPAWFLARQWQTGEFTGEDAGSPLEVSLRYYSQPISSYTLGDTGSGDIQGRPLEKIVEDEPAGLDWRTRVQIGQQFERLARAALGKNAEALINQYRGEYPLVLPAGPDWVETDYDTRRFLQFMAGRVIDGKELLKAIGSLPSPPQEISKNQLAGIVKKFNAWSAALNIKDEPTTSEAWRTPQMDYRFGIKSRGQFQTPGNDLKAPNYRNGDLDWYAFNIGSQEDKNWFESREVIKAVPTRVSIGGASPRWWAFEDAALNLGKLEVEKTDLARLMLIQFMLFYTDDWFLVPLVLPTSTLVKLFDTGQYGSAQSGMKVLNVFGDESIIPAAQTLQLEPFKRWEIFSLSPSDPAFPGVGDPNAPGLANVLFLPAVAGFREESDPLEEILFIRDEGANMVWGIENTVRNGLGRPVNGFDLQRERGERRGYAYQAPEESSSGVPRYRLATTVPENWIPFLPAMAPAKGEGNRPQVRLRRALMLRNTANESPEEIPSMSHLLSGLQSFEEVVVPRAGLRLQLTAQRLRWVDGKTYVWLGRMATAGKGEGSSGLRFDVLRHSKEG